MQAVRIGLPNKGSLGEASARLLEDAGYSVRRTGRELVVEDPRNDVAFFYLRPRDIAVYVNRGALDLGITGRDLLADSPGGASEILPLGFGRSTFRFAARPTEVSEVAQLAGKRIATSFPRIVGEYLAEQGIEAELVPLEGAVEVSIDLGVADAIADVVETGATLEAAGLGVFGEALMHSEAILIARGEQGEQGERGEQGEQGTQGAQHRAAPTVASARILLDRLQGVLVARRYVIVDFDCPVEVQDAAFALVPGVESPTVSPLAKAGWVAVRSLVPRDDAQAAMDALWQVGARAILVSSLESTRL